MRCAWALLLLGIVFAQKYDALLPPKLRIEESEALKPLHARGHPVLGNEVVDATPKPSPSNVPLPVPVDTEHTTIGNCIEHRQYVDYPESLQLVFPGLSFAGAGSIERWKVYSGRNCDLHAQVFRQVGIPKALDQNQHAVSNFELVGTNMLNVSEMGNHTFEIPESEQINVQAGDVVGIFTSDPGCVSWSSGGPTTLYRYGIPGRNEMKAFHGYVFIGEGAHRTYSIACEGDFSFTAAEIEARVSPTPSTSVSGSHSASISPTISPSHSTSVSALPSLTASNTPSPSPSLASTPSHTPSVSPTLFSRSSDCAQGPEYWCSNVHSMRMCNVTAHICEILGHAVKPALPSPVVTSATVSPSFTPSFNGPQATVLPSPTPSMSLVVPPYFLDPVAPHLPSVEVGEDSDTSTTPTEGLTQCVYCNAGSDWKSNTCASGSHQSPISVRFESMDVPAELDLYFSTKYNITSARVHWNDRAFSLWSPSFGSINVDAVNYVADLVKLRSPSEHKLEGMRTPLELQIFHRVPGSNPPKILAVAVLFEETLTDVPSLDWILDIPADKSDIDAVVDLENYLSDLKSLAFYDGSMTEPPCQEGITWAVTMGTGKVNFKQVQKLASFLKNDHGFALGRGNNRAVQPLGDRKVTLRSNCGISGSMSCGRDSPSEKVTSDMLPSSEGGTQELSKALDLDLGPNPLNGATQRENEMAAKVLADAEDLLSSTGDDSMFDDGDVKLW